MEKLLIYGTNEIFEIPPLSWRMHLLCPFPEVYNVIVLLQRGERTNSVTWVLWPFLLTCVLVKVREDVPKNTFSFGHRPNYPPATGPWPQFEQLFHFCFCPQNKKCQNHFKQRQRTNKELIETHSPLTIQNPLKLLK